MKHLRLAICMLAVAGSATAASLVLPHGTTAGSVVVVDTTDGLCVLEVTPLAARAGRLPIDPGASARLVALAVPAPLGQVASGGDWEGLGQRAAAFIVPPLAAGGWLTWTAPDLPAGAVLNVVAGRHVLARVAGAEAALGAAWLAPAPAARTVVLVARARGGAVFAWHVEGVRARADLELPAPWPVGRVGQARAALGALNYRFAPRTDDTVLALTLEPGSAPLELRLNRVLVHVLSRRAQDGSGRFRLVLPRRALNRAADNLLTITPAPGAPARAFWAVSDVDVSEPLPWLASRSAAPGARTLPREQLYTFRASDPSGIAIAVSAAGVDRPGLVELWLNGSYVGTLGAQPLDGTAEAVPLPAGLVLSRDVNLLLIRAVAAGVAAQPPAIRGVSLSTLAPSRDAIAEARPGDGAFGTRTQPGVASNLAASRSGHYEFPTRVDSDVLAALPAELRGPDNVSRYWRAGAFAGDGAFGTRTALGTQSTILWSNANRPLPLGLGSAAAAVVAPAPPEPFGATCTLDSDPSGAAVYLSASPLYRGGFMGATPLELPGLGGSLGFTFESPGYHPTHLMNALAPGDRLNFTLALLPWHGFALGEPEPVLDATSGTPGLAYLAPTLIDVDGDGRVDLVLGDQQGDLYWRRDLRPSGPPEFAAATPLLTAAGQALRVSSYAWPRSYDWDGDGRDDLLVGDGSGRVHILLHVGRGDEATFLDAGTVTAGGVELNVGNSAAPLPVDWDGDARMDLLVGSGYGKLFLCRGRAGKSPRPELGPAEEVTVAGKIVSGVLNLAPIDFSDWNGDGRPDLVVASMFGTLDLYLDQDAIGLPRLSEPRRLRQRGAEIYVGTYPAGFFYDLDEDGYRDLVLANAQGEVYVARGSESGPQSAAPEVSARGTE